MRRNPKQDGLNTFDNQPNQTTGKASFNSINLSSPLEGDVQEFYDRTLDQTEADFLAQHPYCVKRTVFFLSIFLKFYFGIPFSYFFKKIPRVADFRSLIILTSHQLQSKPQCNYKVFFNSSQSTSFAFLFQKSKRRVIFYV